ncbi:hypothetical protein GOODEAATRI_014149 [Goodea atripinnis]|uniref:Uncharacterized protein n=1 Tax=Goodea atripinnis TaxID=208336 RepID=A0ABV0P476_9TELE
MRRCVQTFGRYCKSKTYCYDNYYDSSPVDYIYKKMLNKNNKPFVNYQNVLAVISISVSISVTVGVTDSINNFCQTAILARECQSMESSRFCPILSAFMFEDVQHYRVASSSSAMSLGCVWNMVFYCLGEKCMYVLLSLKTSAYSIDLTETQMSSVR